MMLALPRAQVNRPDSPVVARRAHPGSNPVRLPGQMSESVVVWDSVVVVVERLASGRVSLSASPAAISLRGAD